MLKLSIGRLYHGPALPGSRESRVPDSLSGRTFEHFRPVSGDSESIQLKFYFKPCFDRMIESFSICFVTVIHTF